MWYNLVEEAHRRVEKQEAEGTTMNEVVALGEGSDETPNMSLDVLGFQCPIPVARTKSALMKMQNSEILEMWADDPETLHDIPAMLERLGVQLLSIESDAGEYRFMMKVGDRDE